MNDVLAFNLRTEEVTRLRALMRRARYERLSWQEESELRHLISKQGPISPSMPWDQVVHTGMLIVGFYALAKDIGMPGAPT